MGNRLSTFLQFGLVVASTVVFISKSEAAALSLDEEFRPPAFVQPNPAIRFLLLPDGKYLLFSNFVETLTDQPAGPITRYFPDGTLDTSFSFTGPYSAVAAAAVTPDGELIISAFQSLYGAGRERILRLSTDGSIDPTFNITEVAPTTVASVVGIVLQPDGRILVSGSFFTFAGGNKLGLVRLLPGGGLDPGFNYSGGSVVGTQPFVKPVLQPDGKIIIAGTFRGIGSTVTGVARLNVDGTADSSFQPSGFTRATTPRGLALQPDGKVLIGGFFSLPGPNPANRPTVPIVRLNANGTRDESFVYVTPPMTGPSFVIRDLALRPDGKVVATDSSSQLTVVRFLSDGALDTSFTRPTFALRQPLTNQRGQPVLLSLLPDGDILVGGIFSDVADGSPLDDSHYGIARFNPDGTVDPTLTTAHKTGTEEYSTSFARLSSGSFLIGFSPVLRTGETILPNNLVRLLPDGTVDSNYQPFSGSNTGPLPAEFVAGGFTSLADGTFLAYARSEIYAEEFLFGRLRPDGNQDSNFFRGKSVAPFETSSAYPDGKTLLANSSAQGVLSGGSLSRLNRDGSLDGSFTLDSSITTNQIIREEGTGIVIQMWVGSRVLAVQPDGKIIFIYLVAQDGRFRLVRLNADGAIDPSFTSTLLAPFDLTESYPLVFDPLTGSTLQPREGVYSATIPVADAVLLPDGGIIVAGPFKNFGNTPARGVVRLDANGALDSAFQIGAGPQWTQTTESAEFFPQVEQVEPQTDGNLLIAGTFEAFNGIAAPGLARLTANGSVDASFIAPAVRQKSAPGSAILGLQPDGSFLLSGPYSRPGETEPSFIHINSLGGIPVIGSPAIATAVPDQAFSYQIVASGQPTSYSASGLPPSFSFDQISGLITGSPTAAQTGFYNVVLTATNSEGISAARNLALTVTGPPPVVTSASSASGRVGDPFTYQITASNEPTSFRAQDLPAGLSLDETSGVLSGVPMEAGSFDVTLFALNAAGAGSAVLTVTIAPPPPAPVITSSTTASGIRNQPFAYQITAINNPNGFSAVGLPVGLQVDASSGLISGTPVQTGPFAVTISASNAGGTGSATLTLQIAPEAPAILSSLNATGRKGQTFSYAIFASNNPTSYGATGLPAGLMVNTSNGQISGTPSVSGMFTVVLSATNAGGTGTANLALTILIPTPVLTSERAVSAVRGQPFSYQITATNNPTSFGATVSGGPLPADLSVNPVTGLISGTPSVSGVFLLTVFANNAGGNGGGNVLLTVNIPVPLITSPAAITVVQGQPFSYQITASNSPTSFGAIGLPSGVSIDTANGLISGTPRGSGVFSVTLTAANSTGTGSSVLALELIVPGAANISTRASVGTNDRVLIGGFIIRGDVPKKVIVRVRAPSVPVPGTLADPMLTLRGEGLEITNDDWRSAQEQEIIASNLAPGDDRESAIVVALNPGSYTAVVSGKNGMTGIGLVEVFDLGPDSVGSAGISKLANLSTRGFVQTGDGVMIGGFIIRGQTTNVIVRAVGPTLGNFGVNGALQDTTLELFDANGSVASNDDWRSSQEAQIIATGLAPSDNREAAIVASLAPGGYTAIVRGKNNTNGVGLVELFVLD